ncbi:transglutaminase domain-containing protein [Tenacibaculum sp. MEBiC06402]|uniref:transglutaminase domain-containing protein n=1 Tax=unclassified Tenacibaculum TaxID=2635139 RepID=UPI003B9B769F
MKKIVFLCCVLVFFIGQSQSNFQIKNIVRNYTDINSSRELFEKVEKDFSTNINKVKATYAWITLHIKYQVSNSKFIHEPEQIVYFDNEDLSRKIRAKNDRLVEESIKDKSGVCEHMALTLKKLCDYFNIENELVKGYVRNNPEDIGIKPKFKNHIWNAVKLEGRWLMIDATYGIDYDRNLDRPECNFSYFDISTKQMRLTHYPSKKRWADYLNQFTINKFSALPMFWDGFIKAKAELVSPVSGKLNNSEKKKFITLRNVNENLKITYKFDDENFTKTPRVKRSGEFTNVIINSNKEGILTLYFNNKSAIAFKVED